MIGAIHLGENKATSTLKNNKFIGNYVDAETIPDWRYCDAGAIYSSCLPSLVNSQF